MQQSESESPPKRSNRFDPAPEGKRGAFDFEAWEWVNPRCCGLLWGTPENRKWDFVLDRHSQHPERVAPETLERMLAIAKEDDCYDWWAHNGGRYDVCLLLDAVTRIGWEATGHVAGGRVVVMSVKPPGEKRALRLYDSMALVPASLKSAANDFELHARKEFTEDDYSIDVRKWPVKRMEYGCRVDCECVLELVARMESELESQGGCLKATVASATMSVMEAKINLPDSGGWIGANTISRNAYLGGRVEIFHHTPNGILTEFDVCSSYPWSMTQLLPWKNPRDVTDSAVQTLLDSGMGVVRADVDVPDCPVPVLPVNESGVFFPTGLLRGWWHAHELRYAISIGLARVRRLYGGVQYDAGQPFQEFVDTLYEGKRTSKGAKRTVFKLLLNSAYGKFGQQPERENLKVFASDTDAAAFILKSKVNTVRELSEFDPRFLAVTIERWAKHAHFALAGAITAHSRILLHKYLMQAKGLAYCDTDSVHCDEATKFPTGDKLGEMKIEIPRMRATFYAPKLYKLEPLEGDTIFASKGFELDRKDFLRAGKLFDDAVTGQRCERESMTLVKTQLRNGGKASRRQAHRAWSGRSMKRKPFDDGSTRPWRMTELAEKRHLTAMSPATSETTRQAMVARREKK